MNIRICSFAKSGNLLEYLLEQMDSYSFPTREGRNDQQKSVKQLTLRAVTRLQRPGADVL